MEVRCIIFVLFGIDICSFWKYSEFLQLTSTIVSQMQRTVEARIFDDQRAILDGILIRYLKVLEGLGRALICVVVKFCGH